MLHRCIPDFIGRWSLLAEHGTLLRWLLFLTRLAAYVPAMPDTGYKTHKMPTKKTKPNPRITLKNAAEAPTRVPETQWEIDVRAYEEAIGWFNRREFETAIPLFGKLASAANRQIAHAAHMRLLMCEQRLKPKS